MKKTIAVLAGDGIGPEVMQEAIKVLKKIAEVFGHEFKLVEALIGGAAWDKYGDHFPQETKNICEAAGAILFGSVGGPVQDQMTEKWRDCEKNSILAIRKHFNFNVNLRPVKLYKALKDQCVLRASVIKNGVDILCVRELSQDVYFGDLEATKIFAKIEQLKEEIAGNSSTGPSAGDRNPSKLGLQKELEGLLGSASFKKLSASQILDIEPITAKMRSRKVSGTSG